MQSKSTWWRVSDNIADHTVEALIVTRRRREIATCPTHTKPLSRQDDAFLGVDGAFDQPASLAHTHAVGPRFEFTPGI